MASWYSRYPTPTEFADIEAYEDYEPPDIDVYSTQNQHRSRNENDFVNTDFTFHPHEPLLAQHTEIDRQQLKYMQDQLKSIHLQIQDKESIIENIMLRYDLGIITQGNRQGSGNLSPDEIEQVSEELTCKTRALAKRTVLENFDLRQMTNELKDEEYTLRNEIYELVRLLCSMNA